MVKIVSDYLQSYLKDESGATAIEYALVAAGIAVAIVLSVNTLGESVENTYNQVGNAVAS